MDSWYFQIVEVALNENCMCRALNLVKRPIHFLKCYLPIIIVHVYTRNPLCWGHIAHVFNVSQLIINCMLPTRNACKIPSISFSELNFVLASHYNHCQIISKNLSSASRRAIILLRTDNSEYFPHAHASRRAIFVKCSNGTWFSVIVWSPVTV